MSDDGTKRSGGGGDALSRLINDASRALYEVGDAVREQAARSKQLFDEKMAERELNRSFQQLGKDVFELVARGKLELPESLQAQVDALQAQIKAVAEASDARTGRPDADA